MPIDGQHAEAEAKGWNAGLHFLMLSDSIPVRTSSVNNHALRSPSLEPRSATIPKKKKKKPPPKKKRIAICHVIFIQIPIPYS